MPEDQPGPFDFFPWSADGNHPENQLSESVVNYSGFVDNHPAPNFDTASATSLFSAVLKKKESRTALITNVTSVLKFVKRQKASQAAQQEQRETTGEELNTNKAEEPARQSSSTPVLAAPVITQDSDNNNPMATNKNLTSSATATIKTTSGNPKIEITPRLLTTLSNHEQTSALAFYLYVLKQANTSFDQALYQAASSSIAERNRRLIVEACLTPLAPNSFTIENKVCRLLLLLPPVSSTSSPSPHPSPAGGPGQFQSDASSSEVRHVRDFLTMVTHGDTGEDSQPFQSWRATLLAQFLHRPRTVLVELGLVMRRRRRLVEEQRGWTQRRDLEGPGGRRKGAGVN